MKNFALTLLLVAPFVWACKSSKNSTSSPGSPLVALHTGGCFGYCPVYKLTVLSNGRVRYEGERFVEKEGRDSFLLNTEELSRLKQKIQEVNLWQYPDRIPSEIVDAPSATLVVYEGSRMKKVQGSVDRPAPVLELENMIKDLAEAHDFHVKRGVDPRAVPESSRKELIVKLKPEVNAGNWIAQFTDLRLRLVKRLTADNIWLVAYDSKEVDEASIIELLKNTEGAVEVQVNAKVQERN
ncbi:MAG TPA: DUF6438 domain-containing protein [Saprospiraceae bacterium]|nr:DUF6438 domain-containing protein [Saprospiraceae bacterium]HND86798.1 DUF6438 domain-containing protein [Saprospiraceae bacterium]HNG88596.1 DUF6438 domain-containing protein [Saprospiraceae bacterium]